MVGLDFIAFVVGIVYGYVNPGKEDKTKLFKKGIKYGVIFAVIFSVLNLVLGGGFLSFGGTFVVIVIGVIFLTIMFIAGTLIGDWLETKIKK